MKLNPTIPSLLLALLLATPLHATTLSFSFGDSNIAGVRVTQTESDGTVTVYATDSNGQITLPTTTNTYTLEASLAETGTDPISVQDALYILQSLVDLRTLDDDQIKAADINGDGKITIQDALKVLQHNVELTTINQSLIFYDANTGNLLSETTFNPGDTPSITVIRLGDVNESFDPGSITENLYLYADWNSHSEVIEKINNRHQPYETKVNIDEVWYKTLSMPASLFTSTLDTYTFDDLQSGGIGYGTHLALNDRTYIFHANWEGFDSAANGRAAAMIYDNDRKLIDFKLKKIPGSTHPYALLNKDGSYQILFPGVDEGEIKDSLPGDATSWAFNPADDTFTEISINSGCHGSNKFDYEQDGDEDVICQSWGGEFNYKPIIFKNKGLLEFEAIRVENNDVPGQMSTSAFYDDNHLNIIYTDTNGLALSYEIPELSNVIAKYDPNDLSKIVDVVGLPLPYFERETFKNIPVHVGWEQSVGLSHDVRSHPIDYDNDGDMDIIIASLIWADGSHEYGFSVMQFLTNKDGVYVDETEQRLFNWNLFNPGTHSMHFHDFNGDGYTDIYAEDKGCNWYAAAGSPQIPEDYLCNGRLLVNDGTGHFLVIIETNQLNQISFLNENYPRWYPFPGFSPIIGMTKDKELLWSYINHDYDPPPTPGESINVTVAANQNGSGNVYVIDGEQKKALELKIGTRYTFNHPTNHPFKFSTTSDGRHSGGSEYTDNVDTSQSGKTIITVNSATPKTLNYYCNVHQNMGSSVAIKEDEQNSGDVVINGNVDVVTIKLNRKLSTGPNGIDPAVKGEPDFNEFYYLLHNEEAREAIKNGAYENGLEHYINVGKSLGYKASAK